MIDTSDKSPTDVLMQALSAVEKARRVVIVLEHEDAVAVKTNCSYKELKWLLDQASFVTMVDLFNIKLSRED
jgi:hypothetical protein